MKSNRVFFAIHFSERTKHALGQVIQSLQKQHAQSSIHWTHQDNLHITLQFLAAVEITDINNLLQQVRAQVSGFPTFELMFEKVELFPSLIHPRVISIHVEPQNTLTLLAEKIGLGIVASNYAIETRVFRGHLTLARLGRQAPFSLGSIDLSLLEKIKVDSIVLYRSEMGEKHRVYTVIEKISF